MSGAANDKKRVPGRASIAERGWWISHKWLAWRRSAQVLFLAIFMVGPLTGFWLVKGTLVSSLTLDFLPLADPFVALQTFVAGHILESTALIGAAIIVAIYMLIGGRMYCSWVCPVNMVSDFGQWLRVKLGWNRGGLKIPRRARLWIMAAVLIVSAITGTVAWEFVNPVSILHRAFVFGSLFTGGLAWTVLAGIFLIELVGGNRLWCSRLCPVGAFYGVLGKVSLLRVSAVRRNACDDCMDCYLVCPEAQVITPALKGDRHGRGPVILASDCTNCGRCIDVCPESVFVFTPRFRNRMEDTIPLSETCGDENRRAA